MKYNSYQSLKMIVLSIILLFAVQSCSVMSSDPLLKIHQGQTREEVLTLLGDPHYRRFNQEQEEWEYRRHYSNSGEVAVITFVEGRVSKLDNYRVELPPRPVIERPVTKVIEREVHREPTVGDIIFGQVFPRRGSRRRCDRGHIETGRYPVSDKEFRQIRRDLASGFTLGDERLSKLRFYAKTMAFSCAQTRILLSYFSFEDEKLAALRVLAPCIYDRANISRVINSFTFDKDEAAEILGYPRH